MGSALMKIRQRWEECLRHLRVWCYPEGPGQAGGTGCLPQLNTGKNQVSRHRLQRQGHFNPGPRDGAAWGQPREPPPRRGGPGPCPGEPERGGGGGFPRDLLPSAGAGGGPSRAEPCRCRCRCPQHGRAARHRAAPQRLPRSLRRAARPAPRRPRRRLRLLAARGADGRPGREYRGTGRREGGLGRGPLGCCPLLAASPPCLHFPSAR